MGTLYNSDYASDAAARLRAAEAARATAQRVTLCVPLDADVVRWLRDRGGDRCRQLVNDVLRAEMMRERLLVQEPEERLTGGCCARSMGLLGL
jgi:uncharacterized protein (DUF4415 family)